MDNPSRVRMSGPLEPYRHGFTADLGRLGYSKFTVVALLHLMAHLSRWLADQGLGAGDLTDACVERFLAARRASGQVCRLSPRGLIPLREYLRGLNVAPEPVPPVASTPSERPLEEFKLKFGRGRVEVDTTELLVGSGSPSVTTRAPLPTGRLR